jgi:MoxR-like ATPase
MAKQFTAIIREAPLALSHPLTESHKRWQAYFPAAGLAAAMDVAMLLGQPLLLTGDPGVGKTRAAHWLAGQLKIAPLLRFDVKSTSTGTDLLYQFDEVARFRDSTRKESKPLINYLRFNALGEAILRAAGGTSLLSSIAGEPLEGVTTNRHLNILIDAFGEAPQEKRVTAAMLLPDDKAFGTAGPEHRVVLIDELDKAPRDTPNDLLAEIEDMSFKIPELGVKVEAGETGFRPIVIITSNSEKSLPEPFLRRCAYFDIPFPRRYNKAKDGAWPGEGTLEQIVEGRIEALQGGGILLQQALDLFQRLRRPDSGVRKTPGTAELLAWLDVIVTRNGLTQHDDFKSKGEAIESSLSAVLKNKDDMDAARRIVTEWAKAV